VTPARRARNVRLTESIKAAEQTSLEAMRRFLDTVEDVFPHHGDDRSRRRIVDAAFEMTDHLVASATRFAESLMDVTQKVASESERPPATAAQKAPAKKTAVKKKTPAKKAPVKKAAAKKAPGSTK